ncbi:aminoacyl-tRNA deacylase [Marinobacterium arenosum]|uniref:aminoacyl-tRNA deacylase n=1 Tax=Marinobacterium arenosum TaxID=2862496 RepID=UPI001C93F7CA|nr:YbaK/EbsC family protein [Marinobacterium arenosum]MBY4679134.1 YbaK/EbsC family protein [Marinobacterium arenosum]
MAIARTVYDYLNQQVGSFETIAHPKTATSREAADAAYVLEDHVVKAVLLKDDTGYLQVLIPASQWISLHRLQDQLNRKLELAPESDVDKLFTDCDQGAVTLGTAYGIETIVDEALCSLSKVYLEGGDHEQLIVLSGDQFNDLIKGLRRGHYCEQH